MNSQPFNEGVLAASLGMPPSANPYPPESDDFEQWSVGYSYATDSDEDGEPLD